MINSLDPDITMGFHNGTVEDKLTTFWRLGSVTELQFD